MAGTSRKKSGKAASGSGTEGANPWALHLAAVGAVLFLGALCYANTFDVPFVLDDVTSIFTNPLVKTFDFRLKTRILGDLSFALNYRLGGLEPAGYHAVNLLLHLLNAVFVYLLVQLIFRTPSMAGFLAGETGRYVRAPMAIGFGAAILFVTHPLQTQAVTYLTQRVAVMATFFYLGAVLCYGWSRLCRKRVNAAGLLGLSLLLAVAGVLSKENAVTIPLTILLFEMTFFRGELRRRFLQLAWYLLPLVVVPMFMLGRIGFSSDLLGAVSRMTAEGGAPPRMTYLLTQFPVVVSYLRLFLFPAGQNLDHDVPLRSTPLDPVVIASFLLLAAVAAAGVRLWLASRRTDPGAGALSGLVAFGIGWLFITLSIESGAIPIRDVMFEHRLYLPSVGLVMAITAAGWWLVIRWGGDDGLRRGTIRFVGLVGAVGVVLGVATYMRNRIWQDEVTLWKDVVAKSPAKARAHGSLGHAYQRSGFPDEALGSYREAVRLAPGDHVARNNLGTIYLGRKQPEAALEQFREALRSAPASIGITYNLGLALAGLDRLGEAEAAYRTVIGIDARHDSAFNNLGIVLFRQKRFAEAESAFREAVRINPGNESASQNLANVRKALNPTAR